MSAQLALIPLPTRPEWQRTGRYVALAVALHLAVLALPIGQRLSELAQVPAEPLSVHLSEALHPAPLPQAATAPKPLPVAASTPPTPARKSAPAPKATPVLAMTLEQQPPTAGTPTVAAAPPSPPADPAPATKAGPPAPAAAPITAARFDAAYLQNPKPSYPALSRRLGEEGKVLLKVRVTADGRAAGVDLEKTSGFERLDSAARQAVAGWRFVPAKRGDEAVEASVIVPVVFRLDS